MLFTMFDNQLIFSLLQHSKKNKRNMFMSSFYSFQNVFKNNANSLGQLQA